MLIKCEIYFNSISSSQEHREDAPAAMSENYFFKGLLVVDPSTGTCQPSDFVFPGAPRWRHATTLLGDYLG